MNDQTPIASTNLVEVRTLVPADVFGPGGADKVMADLTAKVSAAQTDISTKTGRAAVASLARKIATSKTAIDAMGKDFVAAMKKRVGEIDAARRDIWDRIEALQHEVRKPLTDWEGAEKSRVAGHEAALAAIPESADYGRTETAPELRARLEYLLDYPERDWQEFSARATKALEDEIERTTRLWEAARTREAEQAEAERLRAEQLAREQAERDARIATEAAEKARLDAEEKAARAQALADARAREEQERVEQERARAEQAKAAAEQAARDAEARAAKAEAERISSEERARAEAEEAARQAEVARVVAENRARDEAEATARRVEQERIAAAEQAERDREAAIEAERQRVADEQAAAERETAQREANKKHRAKINNAARDALVAAGLTAEQATVAVTAIAKGAVPNVKISY